MGICWGRGRLSSGLETELDALQPSLPSLEILHATLSLKRMARRQAATKGPKSKGLTQGEKEAMRETILERMAGEANDESRVLAKIAEMPEPDRTMARRIHAIIKASAPSLSPRTWYGMPAYAIDDKVVCFFQSGHKFKTRYSTLGFQQRAKLDEGQMWPVSFALKGLSASEEAKIIALLKKSIE